MFFFPMSAQLQARLPQGSSTLDAQVAGFFDQWDVFHHASDCQWSTGHPRPADVSVAALLAGEMCSSCSEGFVDDSPELAVASPWLERVDDVLGLLDAVDADLSTVPFTDLVAWASDLDDAAVQLGCDLKEAQAQVVSSKLDEVLVAWVTSVEAELAGLRDRVRAELASVARAGDVRLFAAIALVAQAPVCDGLLLASVDADFLPVARSGVKAAAVRAAAFNTWASDRLAVSGRLSPADRSVLLESMRAALTDDRLVPFDPDLLPEVPFRPLAKGEGLPAWLRLVFEQALCDQLACELDAWEVSLSAHLATAEASPRRCLALASPSALASNQVGEVVRQVGEVVVVDDGAAEPVVLVSVPGVLLDAFDRHPWDDAVCVSQVALTDEDTPAVVELVGQLLVSPDLSDGFESLQAALDTARRLTALPV
jgi:hypothetical protein